MLILSRRNGESFIIGDDIKITVLSQRSNQVRIGIEAPRSLPVHREEVLERQQKIQAATASFDAPSTPAPAQPSIQPSAQTSPQTSPQKRPELATERS